MPDTAANADRSKAASLITKWLEGNITNWDFENQWPESSEDRAVADIGRELWRLYSDFPKRRLEPSILSVDELAVLKRCLAFLQSGEHYEPVSYEEAVPWKPSLLTKLLGVKERPWETPRLKVSPDRHKWWPFADESQWRKVAK